MPIAYVLCRRLCSIIELILVIGMGGDVFPRPPRTSSESSNEVHDRECFCSWLIVYRPKNARTQADVCSTPACVHASSEILYNLSPDYKNIDPCDDFEELVCGGWGERHDLRPDQGDAFTGTIMSENSQMLLRHILEAPYPSGSRVSVLTLPIRTWLTPCIAFKLLPRGACPVSFIR